MTRLSSSPAWRALRAHAQSMANVRIDDLGAGESSRPGLFRHVFEDCVFDFQKNLASHETINLLVALAQQQNVAGWFSRMMKGDLINTTESRSVLHTALRAQNPGTEVASCLERMKRIAQSVRSDKAITDVVHIGIGGSDLGPRMVCEALAGLYEGPRVHFVANVDPDDSTLALAGLKPENTFVTVASKTFTTQETLLNFNAVLGWLGGQRRGRVAAMTARPDLAEKAGVAPDFILPMWDWVGGRYSVTSSVGLPIALAYGFDVFGQFLAGARAADTHVSQAPYARNIPILMGLFSVWYSSFMGYQAHVIAPYSHRLARFPDFLQQLIMESNGKRVDRDGLECDYDTSPFVFGHVGTNAQHSFYQKIQQGTHPVYVDFIGVRENLHGDPLRHQALLANMHAQADAFMRGCADTDPHKVCPGNRPSTTTVLPCLDPYYLGLLVAMYEHKTAAEGFIWNINSFDQFGVELGKKLVKERLAP